MKIGKHVGLSANGVKYALHRAIDPHGYDDEDFGDEVAHASAAEEW